MANVVIRQLIEPMIARLGTMAATYLVVTHGVERVLADNVGLGIGAIALVGVDLLLSRLSRRNEVKRAENKLLDEMWQRQM